MRPGSRFSFGIFLVLAFATLAVARPRLVTDPRRPEGEAWLRKEFEKIVANVRDPASRPSRDTLERVISGHLKPVKGRTAGEVYWEHILLRYINNVPLDIERNYAPDLILSCVGSAPGVYHGHAGVRQANRDLMAIVPTTQYTIVDTVVRQTGQSGWVTERWAYLNPEANISVLDGIDSFLIENSQFKVKIINFTVGKAMPFHVYCDELGINPNANR